MFSNFLWIAASTFSMYSANVSLSFMNGESTHALNTVTFCTSSHDSLEKPSDLTNGYGLFP